MVLSLGRWVGKVAIVTGASSGIGAAIAELLVKQGLIVVGLARRSRLVEDKARQLSGTSGKLHAIKADVSKEEDIVNAFKWVDENLGHVHILINNAGVLKKNLLSDGDAEAWKATLDVNVTGLCIATREAVKKMTANKIQGHIIHINSVAGHKFVKLPKIGVYSASKRAVTSLAEALRSELLASDAKIKVTSVSPGMVVSEMTVLNRSFSPERMKILKDLPILEAEDVAEAVGYVLSTPEHVEIKELTVAPVGEDF